MARITGSWLSGSAAGLPMGADGKPARYRGERLGLPETGPRALATVGRRAGGLAIDWAIATVVAAAIGSMSWNLAVWAVVSIISVALFSMTPGQAAVGIGVARVDREAPVGLWRSVVRVALVGLVLPALFTDGDGRGVQDRLTSTAVIRSR
ncbi:RDD family protein [Rhodococcus sp. X156]|uniref:RDD family protein n=1 Tax=Rhodococcus sp. X156 TaxID=2499145 RepID=UPI000FD86B95|nr:RDD family protein [Rhodococcus sp. X156]